MLVTRGFALPDFLDITEDHIGATELPSASFSSESSTFSTEVVVNTASVAHRSSSADMTSSADEQVEEHQSESAADSDVMDVDSAVPKLRPNASRYMALLLKVDKAFLEAILLDLRGILWLVYWLKPSPSTPHRTFPLFQ